MKKQLLTTGVVLTIAVGGAIWLTNPVAATKYQPNTDTLESPFVIRSVQPSTGKITVQYNGEKDNFQPLSLVNIQAINVGVGATEDQIDENLPWLGQTKPYWNYLIHYEEIYDEHPEINYGSTEQEIDGSHYPREIALDEETLHILYYAVRPGASSSRDYIYGKINYDLCVTSSVYKPGVECRAENKPQGGIWYWPYYNGERLSIPKEEWAAWGYTEEEPAKEETTPATAKTDASATQQIDSVKAPKTGERDLSYNLPWDLVALFLVIFGIYGMSLYRWFGRH